MENTAQQKTYKRQLTGRAVSPETAQKISSSLRAYNATHPRSDEWRQKQSDGLKAYWLQIEPKQADDTGGETTWDDIIL